jgi:uncharacterized protein
MFVSDDNISNQVASNNISNKIINATLITGASSGIGLEFAKIFAREGHNLVLVARSEETLSTLKKQFEEEYDVSVRVIVKDLTHYSSPTEIYDEVKRENINVNILVNNAGFGVHGYFKDTDLESELEMIQVNITALTHLTKLFLKDMVDNNNGRILNVASVAAFQPGPLMAVYYASKAYVLSFSEAIAEELRDTKVKVTTLCPGLVKTNFSKVAHANGSLLFDRDATSAKDIAEYGYKALYNDKRVVIPGIRYKTLVQMTKFIPRKTVTKVLKKFQEKRK